MKKSRSLYEGRTQKWRKRQRKIKRRNRLRKRKRESRSIWKQEVLVCVKV